MDFLGWWGALTEYSRGEQRETNCSCCVCALCSTNFNLFFLSTSRHDSSFLLICPLLYPTNHKTCLLHIPHLIPLLCLMLILHFLGPWFSSSPPSTSDPGSPHFLVLWVIPKISVEVLVQSGLHIVCVGFSQEAACVVASGQRWHSPAGMRREQSLGVPRKAHY